MDNATAEKLERLFDKLEKLQAELDDIMCQNDVEPKYIDMLDTASKNIDSALSNIEDAQMAFHYDFNH